jgi:hypothetical protein
LQRPVINGPEGHAIAEAAGAVEYFPEDSVVEEAAALAEVVSAAVVVDLAGAVHQEAGSK